MLTLRSKNLINNIEFLVSDNYSPEVYEREKIVLRYWNLRKEGCSENVALETLEVTRATLFRWKRNQIKKGRKGLQNGDRKPNNARKPKLQKSIRKQVYNLRKENPLYGKHKINALLKRKGVLVSGSTVGRVISDLIKQGKIQPVDAVCGKKIRKRIRRFKNYAEKFQFGMNSENPGEMVQVDQMFEGVYRHFSAICPTTKIVHYNVYRKGTSKVAATFLYEIINKMPFKISSIQVDGGSEFMGEFESACKKLRIRLFVLPPRSPKLNSSVERANGTAHYEFYEMVKFDGYQDLKVKLEEFVKLYNRFRPHQHLQYLTPMEYYKNREGLNII